MAEEQTFDFLKTLEGRSYPEQEVTVYIDEAGLHELHQIGEDQKYIGDVDSKEYKALERRKKALVKQVGASAMTFKARGVAPAIVQTLVKKYGEAEDFEGLQDELLAAVLVAVVNAEGAEDRRKYSKDDAKKIRDLLPNGAYTQLSNMINDLNMNTAIYDETIDAGFLPKP